MVYQLRNTEKGFTVKNSESQKVKTGYYIASYQKQAISDLSKAKDKSKNEVVRELLDLGLKQLLNSKSERQTAPEMEVR